MQRTNMKSLWLVPVLCLLTGCMSTLADMQTANLTKKMPDGSLVHYNYNVIPSAAWGCEEVGARQFYNWQQFQTDHQFQLSGPMGALSDQAVTYISENHLPANYVNMTIPDAKTFSVGSGAASLSFNRRKRDNAMLTFYHCQKINPDHRAGIMKSSNTGLSIG